MVEPSLSWLWDYTGTILGSWLTFFLGYRLALLPFALLFLSGLVRLFEKFFTKKGGD